MKDGISIEGFTPEWADKEADKSNKMIRAWMLEEQGDIDTALSLYAEVAMMEEQIAEYSLSIGLRKKSWINAISAAGCWAKAGDLSRALQGYETLLQDTALPAKTQQRIHALADKLRDERRQWFSFWRQLHNAPEQAAEQESSELLAGVGTGV